MQQGFTHRRQRGDLRGAGAHLFGADHVGDVLAFQDDALAATGDGVELHVQVRGQDLEGFLVGQVDAVVARGEGQ
ncbi:hypothetical protein D9M70_593480 [compost metagenome]